MNNVADRIVNLTYCGRVEYVYHHLFWDWVKACKTELCVLAVVVVIALTVCYGMWLRHREVLEEMKNNEHES